MIHARSLRSIPALLAVPLVLQLTACCCQEAWEEAQIEAERAEAERQANMVQWKEIAVARAGVYGTLHAKLDPAGYTEAKACPEDVISAHRGPDAILRTSITSVDYASLPDARAQGAADWTWLNSTYAADLATVAADPTADHYDWTIENLAHADRRFLAVFTHRGERAMPSNYKKGFLSGPSFDGGYATASIVIVDLDGDGAVLCHAPFSAENSESVDVGDGKDEERMIARDFKDNYEWAAQNALDSITELLSINVVGIF